LAYIPNAEVSPAVRAARLKTARDPSIQNDAATLIRADFCRELGENIRPEMTSSELANVHRMLAILNEAERGKVKRRSPFHEGLQ